MIDWPNIDENSEPDWVKLTAQLIANAQSAAQSMDDKAMKVAADDILDYFTHNSFCKPDWAGKALVRAQAQLTAAREALGNDKLGGDKLDAIVARMSSAGNELKAQAAQLSLRPVNDALRLAVDVAAEVKSIAADVKKLSKDDISTGLAGILKSLDTLREKLGSVSA